MQDLTRKNLRREPPARTALAGAIALALTSSAVWAQEAAPRSDGAAPQADIVVTGEALTQRVSSSK
ncbi:MAG TPA: hypothetical protein VMV37_07940, partial [Gammaproteobacteria bacterium]|nr:hypothetical protein [Gammaproteobacteria bacterium]